jgi:hypothetical protein
MGTSVPTRRLKTAALVTTALTAPFVRKRFRLG